MKKLTCWLMMVLMLISVGAVSAEPILKDTLYVIHDPGMEPYGFNRDYTKNITTTYTTIVDDDNWYADTTVSCKFVSSSGPSKVYAQLQVLRDGAWFTKNTVVLGIGDVTAGTMSAGPRFRIRVKSYGSNTGDCTFRVVLS